MGLTAHEGYHPTPDDLILEAGVLARNIVLTIALYNFGPGMLACGGALNHLHEKAMEPQVRRQLGMEGHSKEVALFGYDYLILEHGQRLALPPGP